MSILSGSASSMLAAVTVIRAHRSEHIVFQAGISLTVSYFYYRNSAVSTSSSISRAIRPLRCHSYNHEHLDTCGRANSESSVTSYVPPKRCLANCDVFSVVHIALVSLGQDELVDLHAISRTCIIPINVTSCIIYFNDHLSL